MRMRNLSAAALAVLLATSAAARADESHFDQQLSADPHGIVEISNFSGRIEVSGVDLSLVIGLGIAVVVAWRYWGWLLNESEKDIRSR